MNRPGTPTPAFLRDGQPAPRTTSTRHCWAAGPAESPGPWPGVVAQWRRVPTGWEALVTYVITEDVHPVLVTCWLSAAQLTPATPPQAPRL